MTQGTIIKAFNKLGNPVLGIQASRSLGTLSALNVLADYLIMTGSISADLGKDVQDWLRQMYDKIFSYRHITTDLEALALKKYPLF
ncbi:hypothetical protein AKJ60_00800 [candidate division MSBL1 archaeon SCGC-AAA385M11]|nr:hypothetical protein AKJ60_00800 [candidate division MSBL1 archaeon SCGC-AAA385M11]